MNYLGFNLLKLVYLFRIFPIGSPQCDKEYQARNISKCRLSDKLRESAHITQKVEYHHVLCSMQETREILVQYNIVCSRRRHQKNKLKKELMHIADK